MIDEDINELNKQLKRVAISLKFTDYGLRSERLSIVSPSDIGNRLSYFIDYLDYLSTNFNYEETILRKERNDLKNSVDNLLTLDMIRVDAETKRFQHFQQILYQSLLIAIISYIEDIIVSFCMEVDKAYRSPPKKGQGGVLYNAFYFLELNLFEGEKNPQHQYFLDIVNIRNDFVHNGGRLNKSKRLVKNKKYHQKIAGERISLNKEMRENVLENASELFSNLFESLNQNEMK